MVLWCRRPSSAGRIFYSVTAPISGNSSALYTRLEALSWGEPLSHPIMPAVTKASVHMGTDILTTEIPPQQQGVGGVSTSPESLLFVGGHLHSLGVKSVLMLEPGQRWVTPEREWQGCSWLSASCCPICFFMSCGPGDMDMDSETQFLMPEHWFLTAQGNLTKFNHTKFLFVFSIVQFFCFPKKQNLKTELREDVSRLLKSQQTCWIDPLMQQYISSISSLCCNYGRTSRREGLNKGGEE